MRIELLEADLAELEALGLTPLQALRRGLRELGRRPTYGRLRETGADRQALEELVHFYAQEVADLRRLRFAYATSDPDFERSRQQHEAVERATAELRRRLLTELRARLETVRREEEALETALRDRGGDPGRIGPHVLPEQAIDLRAMPYHEPRTPLTLSPPPVPSGLLRWLRWRLSRRGGRGGGDNRPTADSGAA